MLARSGELGLIGVEADPVRSREHILLSNILQQEWSAGRDLDIATLIQKVAGQLEKAIGAKSSLEQL